MSRFFLKQFILLTVLLTGTAAQAGDYHDNAKINKMRLVGTWSINLDAGPFMFPGFSLTGLATFHLGGTLSIADAGDFGGLGTLDSDQFGIWRRGRDGYRITNLILSLDTEKNLLLWQRVTMRLAPGESRDHLTGVANVSVLACDEVQGVPQAITCPDPVVQKDAFMPIPPFDIPVELRRLRLVSD